MALQPGSRLAHYEFGVPLGEGGMGRVYRASDTRLGREVAIKVLPAEVTADVERRQRFHQEAMLAAAFHHPNIATVHDVGEQDGVTYIVMELVRGESLRDLIGDEPLDIGRAVDIATGIASGLARAHREGVLHRGRKPDNVVLTDDGVPKILDFGLGKLICDADPPGGEPLDQTPTATMQSSPYLTRAGRSSERWPTCRPSRCRAGRSMHAPTRSRSEGCCTRCMVSVPGVLPFLERSAQTRAARDIGSIRISSRY